MNLARHIKLAPVLLLALLAIGTSVQIGCGGSISGTGAGDDALRENPFAPDDTSPSPDPGSPGCIPYSYGYYGCGGGYGYGGSGYGGSGYGYDR